MPNTPKPNLFICLILTCACATTPQGQVLITEGEPKVELVSTDHHVPNHLLTCGLIRTVNSTFPITTYLSDEPNAISLYDFRHSPNQLVTWHQHFPGQRAYRLRRVRSDDQATVIGRAISEPCFGNGADANKVIRQIILHRATGTQAHEALHGLLKQQRTTHFLIHTTGEVFQVLDPVHAAYAPTDSHNYAIYIAFIIPPTYGEWLSQRLKKSNLISSLLGAQQFRHINHVQTRHAQKDAPHPAPKAINDEQCTINNTQITSPALTDEQMVSARVLIRTLTIDYGRITMDIPIDPSGKPLQSYLSRSAYHTGIMADYHTRQDSTEPGCLDILVLTKP